MPRRIRAPWSVILPHNFNSMMLQATIAILLLVGFESVTSLGEEAKNPKKDIPRGVLLSITIQCLFMYLIEYFAANYFMNSAYSLADAKGSAAPIGDMMVIIGNTMMGGHGQAFMLIEALTVFLALIGTTLSCINTGARVTYAMGRDEEVPEHFGLAPRRKSNATSRHLDTGYNLGSHWRVRGGILLRRFGGSRRQNDRDVAAQPLVRGRDELERIPVRPAQWAAIGDVGFELRHIHALWVDQRYLYRGIPRASRLSWIQAHGGADIRGTGQLLLYGLLYHRADRGSGQRQGASHGSGNFGIMGYLRSDLFRSQFQKEGQGYHPRQQARITNWGGQVSIRRRPPRLLFTASEPYRLRPGRRTLRRGSQ